MSLWTNVENLIDEGRLLAPDIVYSDLKDKSDYIYNWAKLQRKRLFYKISSEQLIVLRGIENKFPNWIDPSTDKNQSDPYVIALAVSIKREKQKGLKYSNIIVVTEESKDVKRLKIPKVCGEYNINVIDLNELFEKENWKF